MMNDFYCDEVLSVRTPVTIVRETDDVLAFHHTRPYWAVHIVVVPRGRPVYPKRSRRVSKINGSDVATDRPIRMIKDTMDCPDPVCRVRYSSLQNILGCPLVAPMRTLSKWE